MDFPKIFEMGPHLYLGLAGLATDVQTVYVIMICSSIFFFFFRATYLILFDISGAKDSDFD